MGKVITYNRCTHKRGVNMCKILKSIHGKTAEEILNEYGQDDSIPVNLNNLLLNIGLSALPFDFTEYEKMIHVPKGDVLGLVLAKGDNAAIFFKKDDSLNRQRFTIAHELAHCCLGFTNGNEPHIEFRLDEQDKDNREKEADIFAGELLIPLKKLQTVYLNLPVQDSVTLASKFAVSVNVMEARLNYLKVSHFDKNGQAIVYENE